MRVVCFVLAVVLLTISLTGCGSNVSTSKSMARQQQYGRLAIVCAPQEEANPTFAPLILEQAQSRIFPLDFLERVDCLSNIVVDVNSIPPTVHLDDFNSYDCIAALVYSYGSGHVYLDLYIIDTLNFEQIWHYQFDSPDPDIKKRLQSQGLYTPAIIREEFYGL